MSAFTLHPRLEADTIPLGRLTLARALLMKDARWPWLILVPEREGAEEIFDLGARDRGVLTEETSLVAEALSQETGAYKINLGALGNMVRQLHIHVIARQEGDAGWPGPVWGQGEPLPYGPGDAEALAARLARRLGFA